MSDEKANKNINNSEDLQIGENSGANSDNNNTGGSTNFNDGDIKASVDSDIKSSPDQTVKIDYEVTPNNQSKNKEDKKTYEGNIGQNVKKQKTVEEIDSNNDSENDQENQDDSNENINFGQSEETTLEKQIKSEIDNEDKANQPKQENQTEEKKNPNKNSEPISSPINAEIDLTKKTENTTPSKDNSKQDSGEIDPREEYDINDKIRRSVDLPELKGIIQDLADNEGLTTGQLMNDPKYENARKKIGFKKDPNKTAEENADNLNQKIDGLDQIERSTQAPTNKHDNQEKKKREEREGENKKKSKTEDTTEKIKEVTKEVAVEVAEDFFIKYLFTPKYAIYTWGILLSGFGCLMFINWIGICWDTVTEYNPEDAEICYNGLILLPKSFVQIAGALIDYVGDTLLDILDIGSDASPEQIEAQVEALKNIGLPGYYNTMTSGS